ncbi:hypothetical protein HKD37_01G001564 [Glycine soja]
MASKKRQASTNRPHVAESTWYSTRFTSELAYTDYDEFLEELERRHWDRKLTKLPEKNINVALVKEFYANVYGFEDGSPKQCNIRFNAQTLNTFLETPWSFRRGRHILPSPNFYTLTPTTKPLWPSSACLRVISFIMLRGPMEDPQE